MDMTAMLPTASQPVKPIVFTGRYQARSRRSRLRARADDLDGSAMTSQTEASDGVFAALAGTDADGFFEPVDEDLAVADATGLAGLFDGFDHLGDLIVGYHDLNLDLGH